MKVSTHRHSMLKKQSSLFPLESLYINKFVCVVHPLHQSLCKIITPPCLNGYIQKSACAGTHSIYAACDVMDHQQRE
ncbi:hypothetical protein [Cardinium endosymbiont of Culicoides punctatus]|uniref:hypothetical protein n=1 Tax=Cardinium endosymbiont of Culicoides punctatus TaxID=2304601 RepID=UPI001058DED3|nr:hypothetical protein [Cardinium endosymbiont of Culicoides punctatus]TDG95510.1 hypothetical protein CCPUN_03330 [Cardinium endosymbiont of Culicoides punctatus]